MIGKALFIAPPGTAGARNDGVADSAWTIFDLTEYSGKYVAVSADVEVWLCCLAVASGGTPTTADTAAMTAGVAVKLRVGDVAVFCALKERGYLYVKSVSGTADVDVQLASP